MALPRSRHFHGFAFKLSSLFGLHAQNRNMPSESHMLSRATCAMHPGAVKSTEHVLSEDDNCCTLIKGPRLVVLPWQH